MQSAEMFHLSTSMHLMLIFQIVLLKVWIKQFGKTLHSSLYDLQTQEYQLMLLRVCCKEFFNRIRYAHLDGSIYYLLMKNDGTEVLLKS